MACLISPVEIETQKEDPAAAAQGFQHLMEMLLSGSTLLPFPLVGPGPWNTSGSCGVVFFLPHGNNWANWGSLTFINSVYHFDPDFNCKPLSKKGSPTQERWQGFSVDVFYLLKSPLFRSETSTSFFFFKKWSSFQTYIVSSIFSS